MLPSSEDERVSQYLVQKVPKKNSGWSTKLTRKMVVLSLTRMHVFLFRLCYGTYQAKNQNDKGNLEPTASRNLHGQTTHNNMPKCFFVNWIMSTLNSL